MRHQKGNKKLGKPTDQRLALIKNLCVALVDNNRIVTTTHRAKAAKRVIETLITKAKVDTVANRRYVMKHINNKDFLKKLFELSKAYKDRNGEYTRLINVGFRKGDAAQLSLIEFVN